MSQLVELAAGLGALADRLDMTTGPGRAALQKHYIDPTLKDIGQAARRAFGQDMTPFANKKQYPVTFTAKIVDAPTGTDVGFQLGPKGFWVMGQYGAGPHTIRAKKKKGLHAQGAAHPTRQPVQHPGSKPKKAIDGAWRAIHHDRHQRITAAVDELWTLDHG